MWACVWECLPHILRYKVCTEWLMGNVNSITHFIQSSTLEVDGAQTPTGHHPCMSKAQISIFFSAFPAGSRGFFLLMNIRIYLTLKFISAAPGGFCSIWDTFRPVPAWLILLKNNLSIFKIHLLPPPLPPVFNPLTAAGFFKSVSQIATAFRKSIVLIAAWSKYCLSIKCCFLPNGQIFVFLWFHFFADYLVK